jgi:hypothetical protein
MPIVTQASSTTMTKEQAQARVTEIKQRVEEIRTTDFSQLTTAQRKDMKQELKGMKKELRSSDPVVVISAGALLLIIIILILIL